MIQRSLSDARAQYSWSLVSSLFVDGYCLKVKIAIYCVKHFPKAFLASEWRTADEIRKLVVSFLNHVPKLALKAPSIDDESNGAQSESQEEYFNDDHFEIDLNNPGLLGLLLTGSDGSDKAAPGVSLEHFKQENEVKKAAKVAF
jgi:hypothetical protein